MKKTVCIDLNGVLDMYSGWKGEGHMDPPRPGADGFLAELAENYRVVIFENQVHQRFGYSNRKATKKVFG